MSHKRVRGEHEEQPRPKRPVYVVIELGKWEKSSQDLERWFEQQEQKENEREAMITRLEAVTMTVGVQDKGMVMIQGRIDKLRMSVRQNGLVLSQSQHELFDLMIQATMPWIVYPNYELHKPIILEELGVTKLYQDINAILPRQYGKTTILAVGTKTLAMFIARKFAIFGTGRRTAEYMMHLAQDFVNSDQQLQGRVIVANASTLQLKCLPFDDEDPSVDKGSSLVRAFPANGKSKSVCDV